ncbi:MAG: hypothetical protein NWF05_04970 [Candidatus Bathyarchaeota archaeon]|nr:hypothetical protein [Candidatus Bathyarchaeota archaeon]
MGTIANIRDILKTLKHKKPAQKFCPRCASPKLHLSSSLDYWLTPQTYICSECGYQGQLYMELEEEKEQEEKKTNNPT